jgi:hypothetical protein
VKKTLSAVFLVGLTCLWPSAIRGDGQDKQPPVIQIPQPGVPQIMTMEAKFVRAAYNSEGYVILGYQIVNRSIGEPWMLLEVGLTVLDNTPDYTLTRDALSLETPDGKTLPCRRSRSTGRATPARSSSANGSSAIRSTTFRRWPTRRAASGSSPISALAPCPGTRSKSATSALASAASISTSPAESSMASTGST